jgi:long-chain acyl-CoA synthetase
MCEAFQMTAAACADEVALRTINDGVSITFADYAERVERLAGALHSRRTRRPTRLTPSWRDRPFGVKMASPPNPV